MCLIKGAFVSKKKFWRYQNVRYNDKKIALSKSCEYKIWTFLSYVPHTLLLGRAF
jgi:hypothetical protein